MSSPSGGQSRVPARPQPRTPQEPSIWPAAWGSSAEHAWNTLWKLLTRLCSGAPRPPRPVWWDRPQRVGRTFSALTRGKKQFSGRREKCFPLAGFCVGLLEPGPSPPPGGFTPARPAVGSSPGGSVLGACRWPEASRPAPRARVRGRAASVYLPGALWETLGPCREPGGRRLRAVCVRVCVWDVMGRVPSRGLAGSQDSSRSGNQTAGSRGRRGRRLRPRSQPVGLRRPPPGSCLSRREGSWLPSREPWPQLQGIQAVFQMTPPRSCGRRQHGGCNTWNCPGTPAI